MLIIDISSNCLHQPLVFSLVRTSYFYDTVIFVWDHQLSSPENEQAKSFGEGSIDLSGPGSSN